MIENRSKSCWGMAVSETMNWVRRMALLQGRRCCHGHGILKANSGWVCFIGRSAKQHVVIFEDMR